VTEAVKLHKVERQEALAEEDLASEKKKLAVERQKLAEEKRELAEEKKRMAREKKQKKVKADVADLTGDDSDDGENVRRSAAPSPGLFVTP
jgi:hypothetical protein